jgi:hypothetical protein
MAIALQSLTNKHKLKVFKDNVCILAGTRNTHDSLWDIPIPIGLIATISNLPSQHHLNAIIRKDLTKTNLIQYLYGCCGSPVVSTWKNAIRNSNFITWPGIDYISIDKHLPKSIASAKGHLDQERKNLQQPSLRL